MSEYFENKLQQAVYTDLHIYTDEPDAMIALITMEQEAHWICMQLAPIMREMAQITVEEGLKELFHHITS